MNTELFIAKRLIRRKAGKLGSKGFISTRPIINIAILGIALGMAVMIIAIAVATGFKTEIRDKVIGFGSHIQITSYDFNSSLESSPIDKVQPFYPYLDTVQGIRHIQVFATKAGIIKTDDEILGAIVKGIGSDFDWNFFKNNIIEGKYFEIIDSVKSNDILISKHIASKLKLKAGDGLLMYFIQRPPRMRKFKIAGIYETGLEEFDKQFVFADIAHIQKLNDWSNEQVGGFEVLLNDYDALDEIGWQVHLNIIGPELYSRTIREANPQIFDWLDLQNMNVQIILFLMVLVAGINMVSALLVLILERTNMIGILKALGIQNWGIRKIFLYISTYLIGKGLLWGNLLGLSLCILQQQTGIFTLDQESYYVSVVPVNIDLLHILLLNGGTLLICVLMLLIPSYIITRISPVKAIRFA